MDVEHLNTIAKDICIPFIIGILTIAVPLAIQTISAIDTKYSSTTIVKEFYKEKNLIWFSWILFSSLISILIWIFKQPRVYDFGYLNELVENSALILLGVTTITLIIFLYLLFMLIKIYYDPEKLSNRFIQMYNSKKVSFQAISDLFYFSINQENQPLARTLDGFIYGCFIQFRIDKSNELVVYPKEFYDVIFEANERVCLRKKKTLSTYNNSTQLYFFFDSHLNTTLSDNTYSTIWNCLRQQIEYDEDEMIISYWERAHEHFDLYLQRIDREHNDNYEITNQNAIDRREEERKRFLEFHYAFGGLLMYKQKYKLLGILMKYTSSQPARYSLVPEMMNEVINRFMKIKEPIIDPWHFLRHYPFPGNVGINKSGIIRAWIKKYIAVLFLRQYTLDSNYYGNSRLGMPTLPNDLSELNLWKQELVNLKRYVDATLENNLLLTEIGFPKFQEQWFETKNKPKPLGLIDEIIEKTKNQFESIKTSQPISKNKEDEFKKNTKEIVLNAIKPYKFICNNAEITSNKSWLINGVRQIVDKTAYTDNQDIGYVNFDSSFANLVATNYKLGISETFYSIPSIEYLLEITDIFPAIDKLNIDPEKFIIVSFGVDFQFLKVEGLEKAENEDSYIYKKLNIINFQTCQRPLVGNTFYVLKLKDLPYIKYNEVPDKSKYFLDELDQETHLSTSIVDLHDKKDLRTELENELNLKDLNKSALVCVELNTEIKWKENIKCVSLKVYSQFWDRGIPSKLSDVREWDNN